MKLLFALCHSSHEWKLYKTKQQLLMLVKYNKWHGKTQYFGKKILRKKPLKELFWNSNAETNECKFILQIARCLQSERQHNQNKSNEFLLNFPLKETARLEALIVYFKRKSGRFIFNNRVVKQENLMVYCPISQTHKPLCQALEIKMITSSNIKKR